MCVGMSAHNQGLVGNEMGSSQEYKEVETFRFLSSLLAEGRN